MTQQKKHHRLKSKKIIVTGIVLLVILAGLGVAAYTYYHHSASMADKKQLTKEQQATAHTQAVQDITHAQQQALGGDTNASNQTIKKALQNPSLSTDDKYALYLQLGINDENGGNNKAALDDYQNVALQNSNYQTYEAIGRVQAKLGATQAAIDAYKKASSLLATSSSGSSGEQQFIDGAIKTLESKK